MIASLTVSPGGEAPVEPATPAIPESAKSLGVALSVGLASVLLLAYVFLKYGGGPSREAGED